MEIKEDEKFYLLGYWCNPYNSKDVEYFWGKDFESRKDTLAFGKRKQERGQPTRFIDWVKGNNKVFTDVNKFVKACEKAGFVPKLEK